MGRVLRRLSSAVPWPRSFSWILVMLLIGYSFWSQFLPIEPYLVPYLTSIKHFSNYQVTVNIYPVSVYAQLVFTLLLAPACFYLSQKVVIILGVFGVFATYLIVWAGKSLLMMQIMQVTYAFGMSARLVFSSYIFVLVPEEEYQTMTSLTTSFSLLSFMLASELSQLLAVKEVSYDVFFVITLAALGVCCVLTIFLPKDHSISSLSPFTMLLYQNEGWINIILQTWKGWNLQVLSLWWGIAFAGFSLVQNYGTNLFDAIDPNSKYNGHVLAASQAAGSIGSYCAVFMESFANRSGMLLYMLGSALMGMLCACMGSSGNIWVAYLLYVAISGIYQTLACLVSVRCSRLLSNGQFVLLFSLNNFTGLLVEALLQATVEIAALSVFSQFVAFAVFFFVSTAVFFGISIIDRGESKSTTLPRTEGDSESHTLVPSELQDA